MAAGVANAPVQQLHVATDELPGQPRALSQLIYPPLISQKTLCTQMGSSTHAYVPKALRESGIPMQHPPPATATTARASQLRLSHISRQAAWGRDHLSPYLGSPHAHDP